MSADAEAAFRPSVEPSLDEVRALARDYNVVPLRHTFIDDLETPVSAFLKLRGETPEFPGFLLESAEQGQRVGRYSFIGLRPRSVLRWSLGEDGDPYALAAAEVQRWKQAPLPDLPPFAGGAVGYFGYDLVRTVETTLGDPNPDEVGLPDMALMLSDVLVVFDHLKHTVTILVNVLRGGGRRRGGGLRRRRRHDRQGAAAARRPGADRPRRARPRDVPEFRSNHERSEFEATVAPDRGVRPRRRRLPGRAVAALERRHRRRPVQRLPRAAGREPVAVHVLPGLPRLPGRGRLARAASTVTGRHVSTRPIAGTRPRGANAEEDAASPVS